MAASTPLPYTTVTSISAYDLIDTMGVGAGIYSGGAPTDPSLPGYRNGEIELISALKYLGLHHIRSEALMDWQFISPPNDITNLTLVRNSIPKLKLNYIVYGSQEPNWGREKWNDIRRSLLTCARMGILSSIEAPNEPNIFQAYSPDGAKYAMSIGGLNQIWKEWGSALKTLRDSDPSFNGTTLLPPSCATFGPNNPDGVEVTIAGANLADYSATYDYMNIHVYGYRGSTLGDPRGSIANGNPPTWGAYPVSIPNWGRYAMPGKRTVITESGSNQQIDASGKRLSDQAHGLNAVNNFFWASYYNAARFYCFNLVDSSTNLADTTVEQFGLYRGDWSKKPAADYVHNYTNLLKDDFQSSPASIPPITVAGKKTATWGAHMAVSRSDGSFLVICNNILSWWDGANNVDLTPTAENWTITLPLSCAWTITDVKTGVTSAVQTGATIPVAVRGYPMIVRVFPQPLRAAAIPAGGSWIIPANTSSLKVVKANADQSISVLY